ncbi:MAG: DUF4097 family beta strand repeat-containing protein [Oscillospiraceae bacterium]|jgi:hypothetical protein|nr:DUF4097 family beta strand repeat-containing protein [Oscillospiraceae bacterium]
MKKLVWAIVLFFVFILCVVTGSIIFASQGNYLADEIKTAAGKANFPDIDIPDVVVPDINIPAIPDTASDTATDYREASASFSGKNISYLEISDVSCRLEILSTDKDYIYAEYKGQYPTDSAAGSSLPIKISERGKSGEIDLVYPKGYRIKDYNKGAVLRVYIPKGSKLTELEISGNVSETTIESGMEFGTLSISESVASVNISGITVDRLEIEDCVAAVKLQDCTVKKSFEISENMTAVVITLVNVPSGNCSVEENMGSIDITLPAAAKNSLRIVKRRNTGAVSSYNYEGAAGNPSITISENMGTIAIKAK